MNLTSLIAKVRALINEPTANFWTDSEITGWINDGIHIIEGDAEYTEGTKTLNTIIYKQKYSLPSDVLHLTQVWWEDDPLNWMDWATYLRVVGSQNLADTGDPTDYALQNGNLYLYPTPDASASGATLSASLTSSASYCNVTSSSGFPDAGNFLVESEVVAYRNKTATKFSGLSRGQETTTATSHANSTVLTERDLTFTYKKLPTDLSSGSDTPNIPSAFHLLPCLYATSLAFGKGKETALATFWMNRFEIELERFKKHIRRQYDGRPYIKDIDIYNYRRG